MEELHTNENGNNTVPDGFTMVPNAMLDAYIKSDLSGRQSRIFWLVIRKTLGWRKECDRIALSQFEKSTGISCKKINGLIHQLVEKNMVQIAQRGSRFDQYGNYTISKYGINKSYSSWPRAKGLSVGKFTTPHKGGSTTPFNGVRPTPFSGCFLPPCKGVTKDKQKIIIKNNITKDCGAAPRGKLIKFAANQCKVTIIGEKVKLLDQLMKIHQQGLIESALKNFADYQQVPSKGRRFPISNDFRSFVHKFDEFTDSKRVAMRLEAEKRWAQEARGIGVTYLGKTSGKKQSDGCISFDTLPKHSDKPNQEEDYDPVKWSLNEIAEKEALIKKRKYWLDLYQESIDKKGKPAKEVLDRPSFFRFQNWSKEVQRNREEITKLRAEIAIEQTKREISHASVPNLDQNPKPPSSSVPELKHGNGIPACPQNKRERHSGLYPK